MCEGLQRMRGRQASCALQRPAQWAVQPVCNHLQALGLSRGGSATRASHSTLQCTALRCAAHPAALTLRSPLLRQRSDARCLMAVQPCSTDSSDQQRRTAVELLGVNADQQRTLEKYLELVLEQNQVMNLTGLTSLGCLVIIT